MKKFAYFIMILFCLVIFTSCQNNTIKNVPTEILMDDGTAVLAENSAIDFYFYYPENFIMQRNDIMITLYVNDETVQQSNIQNPNSEENFPVMTKSNLQATVFALQSGTYETVGQYWEEFALPSYKEIFQDIEIESEEDITIGEDKDISAKKYTYTFSISGMKFKVSDIIFFRKQQVYNLKYTSTESKYSDYVNVLNTSANTFKFK